MRAEAHISYHQHGCDEEPKVKIRHETDSRGSRYLAVSIDQIDLYLDRNALPAFEKILAGLKQLPDVTTADLIA